ncbi:cytochrome b [Comamonas composti]|uniref:cytochrome b n=1 Tax=Comamonas composti TaxID=408558 RepID=UPI00041616A7|nr:cytochrome b/b6 domain-containing protein [Comamonas composti]
MTQVPPHHNHHDRYDRFSILLHWLMAALLLAELGLGLWMTGLPKDSSGTRVYWFNLHKSLGMVLGLLIVLRLAWAALRPRLAPIAQSPLMQRLASGNHKLLYLFMLLAPATGFLGSVFSGYPIRFFGLRLPQLAERWDAAKQLLSFLHQWAVYALLVLIALHVLAFFHHQFILRDGLLRRMK